MRKQFTKAFKVDAEVWANFVRSAESYGATPSELLRELVGHVDTAMKGIESGRIRSFNGDVLKDGMTYQGMEKGVEYLGRGEPGNSSGSV